jgi:hypothetical protein
MEYTAVVTSHLLSQDLVTICTIESNILVIFTILNSGRIYISLTYTRLEWLRTIFLIFLALSEKKTQF